MFAPIYKLLKDVRWPNGPNNLC